MKLISHRGNINGKIEKFENNPNYIDAANFDFTTGVTFEGHGSGMPTPYSWFGSTADDPGVNKWIKTETISIF